MTMNTITYGRQTTFKNRSGFGEGLMGKVRSFIAKTRAEHELSQLDDRLLADIGLNRSEIRTTVWGN